MNRTIALLFVSAAAAFGCKDKPAPKTKTSVETHTTNQDPTGAKTTTETKDTMTVMPDGTKQTVHTETIKTTPPATPPVPPSSLPPPPR